MEKLGGFAMLFGILIIGIGVFELFRDGADWPVGTLIVGGFIAVTGYFIAARSATSAAETLSAGEIPPVADKSKPVRVEDDPPLGSFSIIESAELVHLDKIAEVVRKDPRVTHVVSDNGRYYTTPDGDDLPEWFALRVYTVRDIREAVMEEIGERIEEECGEAVRNSVSISLYT